MENNSEMMERFFFNLNFFTIPYVCVEKVRFNFDNEELSQEEKYFLENCANKIISGNNIITRIFDSAEMEIKNKNN
jgi:hypothetical protein